MELDADELAVLNAIAALQEEGAIASPTKVGGLLDPPRPTGDVIAVGGRLYRLGLVTVHVPRMGLAAFKLTTAGEEAVAA